MSSLPSDPSGGPVFGLSRVKLRIATLNPGRTGLSSLGTNEVLYSRLWAIAAALIEQEVNFCILPGAQLHPGVQLPCDFPLKYVGVRSTSWARVG